MTYRLICAAAASALLLGSAFAAEDPIATRKAVMKSVGASLKVSGDLLKGEIPYDPLKAQLAMRTVHAVSAGFPTFFPTGTETGGETTASPKIWESKADFDAKMAKMEADALAAIGQTSDVDSFKAAFGTVASNCKGCHEAYRVKK